MTRLIPIFLTALAILSLTRNSRAGDAVAIGYNSSGVWTAVTYYCSGTPAGGKDYRDEAGARAAALTDLRKRAGEDLARQSILFSSDRTGYFAYGRGKNGLGKDLHGVGTAASAAQAETELLSSLTRKGAKKDLKVVYKYHSFGSAPK